MATKTETGRARKAAKPATPAPRKPRKLRLPSDDVAVPAEEDGYLAGITARLERDPAPAKPPKPVAPEVEIREGLKEEVLALLKDNLRLDISNGDFTDPNKRSIKVFFGKTKVAEDSLDVVQTREYEG